MMPFGICSSQKLRFGVLATTFLCTALISAGQHARAADNTGESATSVSREKLLGVARQFVTRIDKGFSEADSYMKQVRRRAGMEPDVDIPDGELLLLKPRFGEDKKIALERDIVGFKQGGDIYLSLRDLFSTAGFAISVDAEAGQAQGWFIREDKTFSMDLAAGKVISGGQEYDILEGDVRQEADDIYVLGGALSQWFGASLQPRFSGQFIDIVTGEKWPVEEKIARRKKNIQAPGRLPPPSMPRKEKPYEIAQIPNAVVSLSHAYRDPGTRGGETSKRTRYSVLASGDIAKLTGEGFVSGDDENKVNNVRMTFSRDSDKPELLGNLEARRFEFGDVVPARLPLTGSASQELGARVTNRETNAPPQFSTTDFTGNVEPNWDVELYRNDHLVGFQTAGDEGRYKFENVDLFMGENDFRIVMYGPQGEIKEEERHLVVDPSRFEKNGGLYDVSVTLNDKQTYNRRESDDSDIGSAHLVAGYQKTFSRDLSVTAGFRARQEDDKQKLYLQGGVSAVVGNTLVDATSAIDEQGEAALELVGRKSFGKHTSRASLQVNSDGYIPNKEQDDPQVLLGAASLKGPLKPIVGSRMDYTLSTRYREQESGSNRFDLNGSAAARIGKINYNKNLSYDRRDGEDGVNERVRGSLGARGSVRKTRWRSTVNYELSPETEIDSLLLDLSRDLTKRLSGRFELEHDIEPAITEGRLSMNWLTDHAIITPRLEIDSEEEVFASMNLRFGVTRDPQSGDVIVTNRSVAARGGVSARVYLDRDGDNIYTEGLDKLLEGVEVKALHSSDNATTNEQGVAFLYNLQSHRLTDIVIERHTLDDPFWLPAVEGVSIRPRPGSVTDVDFPVHVSGEIDGTVYIVDEDGDKKPANGIRLSLYDMAGGRVQDSAAAYDGFYLFSQVPPGSYYLVVNEDDARSFRASRPGPQKVSFDYNGTIIYGRDIFLNSDARDVPYSIAPDLASFAARHPHIDLGSVGPGSFTLNLGSYHSRLLMAVVWYRLQSRYGNIIGDGSVMVPPSQSYSSIDEGLHTLRVRVTEQDFEEVQKKCRAFIARGFSCSVEMFPGGLKREASLERAKKI